MIQTCHCVDLLEEKLFKNWILDHLFFGDTFDCIVGRRRRCLCSKKYMPESTFPKSPYGMKMIRIENIFRLKLKITFKHDSMSRIYKQSSIK